MIEIIHLLAHDAVPTGRHDAVLIRRFGEDDKSAIVTELDFAGTHPAVLFEDSIPWSDVLKTASHSAAVHGYKRLYAVDRTTGPREREVRQHGGDHGKFSGDISDFDAEDGVGGSTMLDSASRTEFQP